MSRSQIIIVMGVTGVGKSTFIRHATGLDVKVGHSQNACTETVTLYQIPDTEVYLMDTPGFDDPKVSDADILKIIATSLMDTFNDQADIKGALYVHSLQEVRMRGSGIKNLLMFKKLLGMNGMSHCRLVTSKWSLQPESVSVAREEELCQKEDFWKPFLAAGAKTARFHDSTSSAIDIIRPLVQGPAFEPLLVKEISKQGKTLPQTQAGQVVNDDIEEARKAHKAEIAVLKEEEANADAESKELIRAVREDLQAKISQLENDKRLLAEAIPNRSGRIGRWIARGTAAIIGGAMTIASGGALAPFAALLYGATEAGAQIHRASD
ncbi:P-loop containing nucleoside triphosphate hydrolase protein [Hyaloscypha variabilis]